MDPQNMTFVIVGLLALGLMYDSFIKQKLLEKSVIQNRDLIQQSQQPLLPSRDIRQDRIYNPLESPEKTYIPTSTLQPNQYEYQMVGLAYLPDTDQNYNPDKPNRYMIYGRPDYQNRNKYNYYVIEESGAVKIPLEDQVELYSGDTLTIPGVTGTFSVTIYDTEKVYYTPL